ncbi:unnamed protein product [Meloidogyne enterolobii]|uniref:Uncharacterized protein n=1 Tax=Meloidogyne enterolobii TaxID=390850 RepID=A0ACB0ZGU5_MELEN
MSSSFFRPFASFLASSSASFLFLPQLFLLSFQPFSDDLLLPSTFPQLPLASYLQLHLSLPPSFGAHALLSKSFLHVLSSYRDS